MSEQPAEIPLEGGNWTRVVRVGDTVRRSTGPQSETVHALLAHLENTGFEGAPRFLGVDEQGREILGYVEGTVAAGLDRSVRWDPAWLHAVGAAIRALHDAVSSFDVPADAVWSQPAPPPNLPIELVCHNDLAPWNLVVSEDRLIFLDWDGIRPASRSWDLAYAAFTFGPFWPDSGVDGASRMQAFLALTSGYGLDLDGRIEVLELMPVRVAAVAAELARGAAAGKPGHMRQVRDGHLDVWRDAAGHLNSNMPQLRALLEGSGS